MSEIRVFGKNFESAQDGSGWSAETRPGGWKIFSNGSRRCRARGIKKGDQFWISLSGRLLYGKFQKAKKSSIVGDDSDLVAQFPGKVRLLLVKPGDFVEAGQTLLQVEAMKMEFTIKAPFAGTVEKILVKEGQQLSPGDRFLNLTKDSKEEEQ